MGNMGDTEREREIFRQRNAGQKEREDTGEE